jgi:hypothetical protein
VSRMVDQSTTILRSFEGVVLDRDWNTWICPGKRSIPVDLKVVDGFDSCLINRKPAQSRSGPLGNFHQKEIHDCTESKNFLPIFNHSQCLSNSSIPSSLLNCGLVSQGPGDFVQRVVSRWRIVLLLMSLKRSPFRSHGYVLIS